MALVPYFFNLVKNKFFKVVRSRKLEPQAKIDNFDFKNSNIIIEGLIWKRKDYFSWKRFDTQKIILLINFIFALTYFFISSSQIFKNDAILINHGSFS